MPVTSTPGTTSNRSRHPPRWCGVTSTCLFLIERCEQLSARLPSARRRVLNAVAHLPEDSQLVAGAGMQLAVPADHLPGPAVTSTADRTFNSVDLDDVSDAALWARMRDGDGDAAAGLYDRYANRIHGYCFRSTGSWAIAQDLTSTVWLEAWRRRGDCVVQQGGSLGPWLFGIAHNVVRNTARSQRRHRAALGRLRADLPAPDHADEVAGRLDEERHMRVVLAAVARLPAHEQDVLRLVAWAGLSQAETAAALGISTGAVKTRLFRARARLRQDTGPPNAPPAAAPRAATLSVTANWETPR